MGVPDHFLHTMISVVAFNRGVSMHDIWGYQIISVYVGFQLLVSCVGFQLLVSCVGFQLLVSCVGFQLLVSYIGANKHHRQRKFVRRSTKRSVVQSTCKMSRGWMMRRELGSEGLVGRARRAMARSFEGTQTNNGFQLLVSCVGFQLLVSCVGFQLLVSCVGSQGIGSWR